MKKIILIFVLGIFVSGLFAQKATRSTQKFKANYTYLKYESIASDVLSQDLDTIEVPFYLNKEYPAQWYVNTRFIPATVGDTTVTIYVLGKVFENEDWTAISNFTTNAVAATLDTAIYSMSEPSFTVTYTGTDSSATAFTYDTTAYFPDSAGFGNYAGIPYTGSGTVYNASTLSGTSVPASISNYYRYFLLRYVIAGNDATGTGIKIDNIEFKIWRREY